MERLEVETMGRKVRDSRQMPHATCESSHLILSTNLFESGTVIILLMGEESKA